MSKSRPSEFKNFANSDIWFDIKEILDERLERLRSDLETCEDYDLPKIQGAIAELRYLILLPDEIVKELNDKENIND
jgi:hypothetical protein